MKGFVTLKTLFALVLSCAAALCLFACAGKAHEANQSSSNRLSVEDTSSERNFDISLGFAGDICLADNYIPMEHLANMGSTDIADGIAPEFVQKMNDVDLMWVNNEFVFSEGTDPLPGKLYTFCGSPDNVSYLKNLGVDVVGLANNHTFDYGQQSFLDTLDTLERAGIEYVGAGRNDTWAYAPVYMQVKGVTIALVAASCAEYTIYTLEASADEPGIAWCYDNSRFLETVRKAAANADFVVVLPHWGTEHSTTLTDDQTSFAHQYIDAGADVVIGTHPHILQGIEFYQDKPILYSLGNFWFDGYDIETALAEVRISGTMRFDGELVGSPQVTVVLHPGLQSGVFTSWESGTDTGARILSNLEAISVNAVIDSAGVVKSR